MNNEIEFIKLLHQINKHISQRLMPIFRAKQISIAEISVLMRMNRKATCHATELATMIGIPTSTVTGILDRLEKRGFLERSQDPKDRRSIQIAATPKTRQFAREMMIPMENMLRDVFRSMPESRTRGLIRDLRYVLQILEEQKPDAA
jgi:DNA-binding MarR family transcriptional regulator